MKHFKCLDFDAKFFSFTIHCFPGQFVAIRYHQFLLLVLDLVGNHRPLASYLTKYRSDCLFHHYVRHYLKTNWKFVHSTMFGEMRRAARFVVLALEKRRSLRYLVRRANLGHQL